MKSRLLPLLLALAGAARASERILVLLDDRSPGGSAAAGLAPAVRSALERRGYDVRLESGTARDLRQDELRELLGKVEATSMLVVTIRFSLPERTRTRGPAAGAALGLSGIAFSAERTTWRGSFGTVSGSGRKDRPLPDFAVSRLLWSFPLAPGATLAATLDEPETTARRRAAMPPDYDAPIARLRGSRPGPRFPLRMRKKER